MNKENKYLDHEKKNLLEMIEKFPNTAGDCLDAAYHSGLESRQEAYKAGQESKAAEVREFMENSRTGSQNDTLVNEIIYAMEAIGILSSLSNETVTGSDE